MDVHRYVNQRTPDRHLPVLVVPALLLVSVICGAGLGVVWAELMRQDCRMQSACPGCPGIVCFELAFSADAARSMLDRWGGPGIEAAQESLRLDGWFICCYVGLIAALAQLPARLRPLGGGEAPHLGLAPGVWTRAGPWVAAAAGVAGLLDVIENQALGRIIADHASSGDRLPLIAGLAASVKLALVIPAALYALVALVSVIITLRSARSRPRLRS